MELINSSNELNEELFLFGRQEIEDPVKKEKTAYFIFLKKTKFSDNFENTEYFKKKESGSFGISAYEESRFRFGMYCFLCVVSCGVFWLLSKWFVRLKLMCYSKSTLAKASHLLCEPGEKENPRLVRVKREGKTRFFEFEKLRYLYEGNSFRVPLFNTNISSHQFLNQYGKGYTHEKASELTEKFGEMSSFYSLLSQMTSI